MDQTPEAPLTPREKIAAGRVKGKLLREERLAREAQKALFPRHVSVRRHLGRDSPTPSREGFRRSGGFHTDG